MKSIEVKCPNCKEKYLAQKFNTRFTGPYMKSECPSCGEIYDGKFLTFVIRQHYDGRQDERNRSGHRFFTAHLVGPGAGYLFVLAFSPRSAPPAVLWVFQAEVLFDIAVHLFLRPA